MSLLSSYDAGQYRAQMSQQEMQAQMPAGDMNPAGAGSDPFGYTGGSLLTPWTKTFSYGGGGTPGAYTPPASTPFGFDKFSFNAPRIDPFSQKAPTAERYADFVAPTAENFQQDPGYQFRLKQGQQALQNSAAAKGTLLTGGTAKALQNYGQEAASQEYGNAYNRALTNYGTNRDTAQQHFGNQMQSFGGNLSAFGTNANAMNQAGQLGLQAATAGWDRNYNLARTQWQDADTAAQRAASAAASNSALSYSQQLQQYNMERGNFFENQDRQYNKLMGVAGLGLQGAGQQAAYGARYGDNAANIYGQAGNAAAAGQVGSANAWAQGLQGAGNAGLSAYYANQYGYPRA